MSTLVLGDHNAAAGELRKRGLYENFATLCEELGVLENDQDRFWNGLSDVLKPTIRDRARQKIDDGYQEFVESRDNSAPETGDETEQSFQKKLEQMVPATIAPFVVETLKMFCENNDFARALVEHEQGITDCITSVSKSLRGHVSDIEVYRRAARFFFPNAKIDFSMTIMAGADETVINEPQWKGKTHAPKKHAKPSATDKADTVVSEQNLPAHIQVALFDFGEAV